MLRHLPNAITALRGASGPLVMALVLGPGFTRTAFWVFLLAIASDMIDGWVARRLNAESSSALFTDPLADKLLTDFSWAALAAIGWAPVPLAVLVIARDLIVGAFWAWGARQGRTWKARPSGQIAVALEGIGLCMLLFHGPWLDVHWPTVGALLGWLALGGSIVQLLEHARPGRP